MATFTLVGGLEDSLSSLLMTTWIVGTLPSHVVFLLEIIQIIMMVLLPYRREPYKRERGRKERSSTNIWRCRAEILQGLILSPPQSRFSLPPRQLRQYDVVSVFFYLSRQQCRPHHGVWWTAGREKKNLKMPFIPKALNSCLFLSLNKQNSDTSDSTVRPCLSTSSFEAQSFTHHIEERTTASPIPRCWKREASSATRCWNIKLHLFHSAEKQSCSHLTFLRRKSFTHHRPEKI